MNTNLLLRKIHYWASLVIAIPLVIIIGAGVLLMLKKEVEWIQPPTQKGSEQSSVPSMSVEALFLAAKSVKQAEFSTWSELKRADFKPDKGVIKFVSKSDWEVQVDTHNGEVLQVAKRRSDIIESIHDGSFFADWAKLGLFLPAGVVLFLLWLTGLYMFVITEMAKARKRHRLAQKNAGQNA